MAPAEIIVFTCTFYASADDVRFACCLAFLREAVAAGLRVVVVDASPSEAIREAMRATNSVSVPAIMGTSSENDLKKVQHSGVEVRKQTAPGKKGAALREALAAARDMVKQADLKDEAILCWQEPEKVDMARHWSTVAQCALENNADVVVPARDPALFRETYPIEQYHSETFANLYVQSAAKTFANFETPLDWHFGPFALKATRADLWLTSNGDLWDAQVLPIIAAIHAGFNVVGLEVPFRAPLEMKSSEEGDFAFVEKRLMQINYLDPKCVDAFRHKT